jgi:hypothetical protein
MKIQQANAANRKERVVIGAQNGTTSARKTDPPGFRGTPGKAGQSGLPTACSCLSGLARVRSSGRVKRSRALLASIPTRDNPADGAPMVHQGGPRPRWWSGGLFSLHRTPEPCLQNALRLFLPQSHRRGAHSLFLLFLVFIDSRKRKLSPFISKMLQRCVSRSSNAAVIRSP